MDTSDQPGAASSPAREADDATGVEPGADANLKSGTWIDRRLGTVQSGTVELLHVVDVPLGRRQPFARRRLPENRLLYALSHVTATWVEELPLAHWDKRTDTAIHARMLSKDMDLRDAAGDVARQRLIVHETRPTSMTQWLEATQMFGPRRLVTHALKSICAAIAVARELDPSQFVPAMRGWMRALPEYVDYPAPARSTHTHTHTHK